MPTILTSERVVITGATGFLGGHLAQRLVELGCRPILLARTPRETAILAGVGERCAWRKVELRDHDAVTAALEEVRPEVLFHLAGTRGRGGGGMAVRDCVALNVCASAHLLEAAQASGVRRVVVVSSADVFGQQPGPHREDSPFHPVSTYGKSLVASAWFAEALHREAGCPVVTLRVFTAYGPGQPEEMFVAQAVRCAVEGRPFRMSAGLQKRDLVHVDDVVDALIAAAVTPGIEGRVFHVGSGQAYPLREVAALIWELAQSEATLEIGARQAAASETHDTWADIALASVRLDWRPRVELAEGLKITIDWQREQLALRDRVHV
jgi:nucleoside-diphosphate-sugar epimerase